jgi:hypothetical protein
LREIRKYSRQAGRQAGRQANTARDEILRRGALFEIERLPTTDDVLVAVELLGHADRAVAAEMKSIDTEVICFFFVDTSMDLIERERERERESLRETERQRDRESARWAKSMIDTRDARDKSIMDMHGMEMENSSSPLLSSFATGLTSSRASSSIVAMDAVSDDSER